MTEESAVFSDASPTRSVGANIGDTGGAAIAITLMSNATITKLDLSCIYRQSFTSELLIRLSIQGTS